MSARRSGRDGAPPRFVAVARALAFGGAVAATASGCYDGACYCPAAPDAAGAFVMLFDGGTRYVAPVMPGACTVEQRDAGCVFVGSPSGPLPPPELA